MTENEVKDIIHRYQEGKATDEDMVFLESWYLHYNISEQTDIADKDRFSDVELAWREIQQNTSNHRKFQILPRIAVAASILIVFSFAFWFFSYEEKELNTTITEVVENIEPGGNIAFLTLSNGQKISLNDTPEGEIANQDGMRIKKSDNGRVIYQVASSVTDYLQEGNKSNTIETPRGGQYQVVLSDGSIVWLNAASSLKFPLIFNGSQRIVELEGEAYFEIAHNKSMPFKVRTKTQVVEVLGTHFNLNAYQGENPITTLLEGSVKVIVPGGISKFIKPGEQTELFSDGTLRASEVNIDLSVAWKDGKFIFRNEPVESVMRKIARWYDVEISYPDGIPQRRVWANISRFQNVSDILELIELSKVAHFKIVAGDASGKGRRIIVMK